MEDYYTLELIAKYKTSPLKMGRQYNADEEDKAKEEYKKLLNDNHVLELTLSKIHHHSEIIEKYEKE